MSFPFQLEILQKKVKYLSLRIVSADTVTLTLPRFVSQKKGLQFVEQKKEWILQNLHKKKQRIQEQFSFLGKKYVLDLSVGRKQGSVVFSGDTVFIGAQDEQEAAQYFQLFLKKEAKKILPEELRILSEKTGLQYKKVTIRTQKTRWGSCSARKTLSLNSALMRLRKELREYVLIHELCHTEQMNHSQKFWTLVEKFCPRYREHRKELKQYDLVVA